MTDGSARVVLVTGADTPAGAPVVEAWRGLGAVVLAGGTDQAALAHLAGEQVVPLTLRGADPVSVRVALAVALDRFGRLDEVVLLEGLDEEPPAPAGVADRIRAAAGVLDGGLPRGTRVRVVVRPGCEHGSSRRPLGAAADAALAAWARGRRSALDGAGIDLRVDPVAATEDAAAWGRRLGAGRRRRRVQDLVRRVAASRRG